MKTYKKSTLLLGLAILSSGPISAETKWEISNRLMTISESLFSAPNLFDRELDPDKSKEWSKALKDLESYVKANAFGDKKLLDAARLSRELGFNIARTIIDTYRNLFSSLAQQRGKSELMRRYSEAKNAIFRIELNKTHLIKIADMLEEINYHFYAEKKNDAKEVLLGLIFLFQKTVERMAKDFKIKGDQMYGFK